MAESEQRPGQPTRRGLYMISVAASLAGMHPQTLRIYEQRQLISPQRTPKGTRLYSDENVERLRRIQELTEEGMNLTGVERVFGLEAQLARARRRIASLERQLEQSHRDAIEAVERVRRLGRAEIVLYQPPPAMELQLHRDESTTRIPIDRKREQTKDAGQPTSEEE